jgi:hypothetical protein
VAGCKVIETQIDSRESEFSLALVDGRFRHYDPEVGRQLYQNGFFQQAYNFFQNEYQPHEG